MLSRPKVNLRHFSFSSAVHTLLYYCTIALKSVLLLIIPRSKEFILTEQSTYNFLRDNMFGYNNCVITAVLITVIYILHLPPQA